MPGLKPRPTNAGETRGRPMKRSTTALCVLLGGVAAAGVTRQFIATPAAQGSPFRVEEATIADLHRAIRDGRTTCAEIVQHYIARAAAYNGVSSALLTEDGAPVTPGPGTVRAGAPLKFPTATVKASTLLPDLDKYNGPPLEYGRMEATASGSVRPAAIRHDCRYPERGAGQRAQHTEPPR